MAGDPTKLQVRYGFEATPGHGDASTFHDVRVLSESMGGELPTIVDDSILPTGEQEEGLPSKIDPSGDWPINYHAEDHAQAIAAFFGKGATPVQSPTGVFTHKLAVTETAVTFGSMVLHHFRDINEAQKFVNARPSQLTFNAAARSLLNGAISWVTPRFHYWDLATQGVGTGSTVPIARGWGNYANLTAADGDLVLVITSAPVGDAFQFTAQVGAAGTPGTAISGTLGQWNECFVGAADDTFGTFELPVEIFFPVGATLALNDEFTIPRDDSAWAQALPDASAFNEIAIRISVDGVQFRTRDLSLTANRPIALDEAIGGRFVDNVLEQGERTYTGELNRRALDRSMINRLLAAQKFEIELDARSTLIGSTGVRRQLKLIAKECVPSGRTPSVGGKTAFDESIAFTCHPSDDVTYPAALTAELVNSQADLTA